MKKSSITLSALAVVVVLSGGVLISQAATGGMMQGPSGGYAPIGVQGQAPIGIQEPSAVPIESSAEPATSTGGLMQIPPLPQESWVGRTKNAIQNLYFYWTIPSTSSTVHIMYEFRNFKKIRIDVYDKNNNFVKTTCRHGYHYEIPSNEFKSSTCTWDGTDAAGALLKPEGTPDVTPKAGLMRFKIFGSNSNSAIQYSHSNPDRKRGINDNVGTDPDDTSYVFLKQTPLFHLATWVPGA